MTSQLFAPPVKEEKIFGWRYNSRYHMPLLPGENGTKAGGDYVPYGVQSTTNLMDAFEEARALSIWEQEQVLLGLVRQPSLYEKTTLIVHRADRDGVDWSRLRDFPDIRRQLTGGSDKDAAEVSIIGLAKQAAGANEAREAGTNRHEAWEHYCKTGEIIGTPEIQEQILALVRLLEEKQFQIIPELSERVVRNTTINVAGRFDNILLHMPTGRLIMADLKTKRRPFWSWMAVDGQLATYARSDKMLDFEGTSEELERLRLNGIEPYVPGPVYHVDLTVGVVLHMPSDGGKPCLRKADLEYGWRVAQKAREITEMRSYGKSVERQGFGEWE